MPEGLGRWRSPRETKKLSSHLFLLEYRNIQLESKNLLLRYRLTRAPDTLGSSIPDGTCVRSPIVSFDGDKPLVCDMRFSMFPYDYVSG